MSDAKVINLTAKRTEKFIKDFQFADEAEEPVARQRFVENISQSSDEQVIEAAETLWQATFPFGGKWPQFDDIRRELLAARQSQAVVDYLAAKWQEAFELPRTSNDDNLRGWYMAQAEKDLDVVINKWNRELAILQKQDSAAVEISELSKLVDSAGKVMASFNIPTNESREILRAKVESRKSEEQKKIVPFRPR